MKKALTALLAAGFALSFAGIGYACTYHSATAEHNLKVAMAGQPQASDQKKPQLSTPGPDELLIETKEKAE